MSREEEREDVEWEEGRWREEPDKNEKNDLELNDDKKEMLNKFESRVKHKFVIQWSLICEF